MEFTIPSLTMNEVLAATPISEVHDVFAICSDAAAGRDGFDGFFYKECWPIIGEDLTAAVRSFFMGEPFLKAWKP